MRPHRILRDFPGSQNGSDSHQFVAGTVAHLSDDLAAIAVKEGWAVPHIPPIDRPTAPAEARDTKVVSPPEIKSDEPDEPTADKPKKGRK